MRVGLLQAIAVQEHEEFVQFTAQERLIYRQACHDHEMFVEQLAYEGASVDTREALLKRCAHFCLEMDAGDAGEAVRFLGRRKRAHIEQLQQQLELEACRAAHLSVWESCKHGLLAHKAQHAEAEKFIHEVYQTSEQVWKEKDPEKKSFEMQIVLYDQNGERRLRPEVRFKQPFRDAHVYPRLNFRHLVQHAVARQCVHSEPRAERLLSQLKPGHFQAKTFLLSFATYASNFFEQMENISITWNILQHIFGLQQLDPKAGPKEPTHGKSMNIKPFSNIIGIQGRCVLRFPAAILSICRWPCRLASKC